MFVHARAQYPSFATDVWPLRGLRSCRDLALVEMVMHKHQRVAHAWHVKYERLRHATHEYKSILPDHIACHACGNIVDFHLAFVHARVPMSLRECYPCRMPTASKRPNSRDPGGVQHRSQRCMKNPVYRFGIACEMRAFTIRKLTRSFH
jgi:hypothetical protein